MAETGEMIDLEGRRKAFQEVDTKYQVTSSLLTKAKQRLSEVTTQLSELEATLGKRKAELERDLQQLGKDILNKQSEYEKWVIKSRDEQQQLRDGKEALDSANNELDDAIAAVAVREDAIGKQEISLAQQIEKNEVTKNKLSAERAYVDQLSARLNDTCASTEETQKQSESTLNAAKIRLAELDTKYAELALQQTRLDQSQKILDKSIVAIEADRKRINQLDTELQARVTKVDSWVASQEDDIQKQRDNLQTQEKSIAARLEYIKREDARIRLNDLKLKKLLKEKQIDAELMALDPTPHSTDS